jgi:hypothetical protein
MHRARNFTQMELRGYVKKLGLMAPGYERWFRDGFGFCGAAAALRRNELFGLRPNSLNGSSTSQNISRRDLKRLIGPVSALLRQLCKGHSEILAHGRAFPGTLQCE